MSKDFDPYGDVVRNNWVDKAPLLTTVWNTMRRQLSDGEEHRRQDVLLHAVRATGCAPSTARSLLAEARRQKKVEYVRRSGVVATYLMPRVTPGWPDSYEHMTESEYLYAAMDNLLVS